MNAPPAGGAALSAAARRLSGRRCESCRARSPLMVNRNAGGAPRRECFSCRVGAAGGREDAA